MKNKIFIIGNGFDLAHNLPTKFDTDFKNITMQYEQNFFWDLYQTQENDIWSNFENLLGCPDFNCLEEIFVGYEPNYLSDRESDRDSIISQVELNGRLMDELYTFANNAEYCLSKVQAQDYFIQILDFDAYYINFNYTHTLENIYNICEKQVLHIHGEVGKNNLMLGYPKGNFTPEKYYDDVRKKGRGPYIERNIEDYIATIDDYYKKMAFSKLVDKCEKNYKEIKIDLLNDFLDNNQCEIKEIIVYGHSCAIDFDYFYYLNKKYLDAHWKFYIKGENQKQNVEVLISKCGINHFDLENI